MIPVSFSLFLYFLFFLLLLLLLLFYVIINFYKNYFIVFFFFFHENFFYFFMFRYVPECSVMFHVPDFINAPYRIEKKPVLQLAIQVNCS